MARAREEFRAGHEEVATLHTETGRTGAVSALSCDAAIRVEELVHGNRLITADCHLQFISCRLQVTRDGSSRWPCKLQQVATSSREVISSLSPTSRGSRRQVGTKSRLVVSRRVAVTRLKRTTGRREVEESWTTAGVDPIYSYILGFVSISDDAINKTNIVCSYRVMARFIAIGCIPPIAVGRKLDNSWHIRTS